MLRVGVNIFLIRKYFSLEKDESHSSCLSHYYLVLLIKIVFGFIGSRK